MLQILPFFSDMLESPEKLISQDRFSQILYRKDYGHNSKNVKTRMIDTLVVSRHFRNHAVFLNVQILNQNEHVIEKKVNLNLQKDNRIFCSWKYMSSLRNTICKENRPSEQSLIIKLSPSFLWLCPLETGINIPFTTILDHVKVLGGKEAGRVNWLHCIKYKHI